LCENHEVFASLDCFLNLAWCSPCYFTCPHFCVLLTASTVFARSTRDFAI
jgi:hypothetical protein